MFENLSPRERVLALLVGSLVPIALLFVGVFWFIGKYNDNSIQIGGLIDQVARENDKMLAAKKADVRRNYYQAVSLPSDIVNSSNDYQNWLLKLVRDELKMEFKSLTPRDAGELKFQTKLIGKRKTFALNAAADLNQLTEFLHKFYSVDLLHRINSLKINPESVGGTSGKKVRTGKLNLIITIEVVSLLDADVDRDFANEYRQLARSTEEYQQVIARRNIFGPANNTPSITARPSSSYSSETNVKVNVTGDDADQNDLLTFELLESSIEGAKLIQSDSKERRASLEIPGQVAGKYEFKVRVKDSGFPAKENEETISVTFKDRVVATPPPEPPPKPKFQHARATLITGIVKNVSNDWEIWVKVRTSGELLKLKEGESFELDEKTWTVHSIEPSQAVIQVENKLLTFRPTDLFNSPRASEEWKSTTETKVDAKKNLETNFEVETDQESDTKVETDSKTKTTGSAFILPPEIAI